MSERRPVWHWVAGTILAAGLFAAGMYLGQNKKPPPPVEAPAKTAPPSAPVAVTAPSGPQFPITPPTTDAAESPSDLPMLDESDAAVLESMTGLFGLDALGELVYPEHVVQRIVATIDNLPRKKVAVQLLPVKPVAGSFAVIAQDNASAIDPKNYLRYAKYVELLDAVDAKKAVGWYRGFYPLFQQAYRELGYPDRYFNDRLIEVIDHLLAAPEGAPSAALTHPEAFYLYADPGLEALSAGDKIMLRIGPANEAKAKAKLREIRRELTGR